MDKLYQRIGFENSPSKKTPLNETNLNKMDKALDDLDNRIIEQDAAFAKSIEEEDKKIEEVKGKVSGLTDTAASLIQSKADAIIVKKSGTTIIATDSSDKGFEQFKTFGKSEQEKTSGKQLLRNVAKTNVQDGITYTVYDDGTVSASGTATATTALILTHDGVAGVREKLLGKEVILSGCPAGGSGSTYKLQCFNYSGEDVASMDFGSGTRFTFTNADKGFNVAIIVYKGATVNNLVFKPMIRLASISDDTYEPYTNGPSPNPEYPQPIVSAGQMLALGKQWFDKDTRTNGSYKHYNSGSVIVNADFFYSDYIKVSQGNYTVSGISVNDPHVCFYDANKNYLSGVLARNFTVPQDGYMVFSAPIVDADNIMLNEGTTALPWEPYTGGVKKAVDVGIKHKLTGKNFILGLHLAGSIYYESEEVMLDVGNYVMSLYNKSTSNNIRLHLDKKINGSFSMTDYKIISKETRGSIAFTLTEPTIVKMSGRYESSAAFTLSDVHEPMIAEDTEQTIHIDRVLRGIPVTDASLANYTDENGQMWCADYGDVERKVWVQRVGHGTLPKSGWTLDTDTSDYIEIACTSSSAVQDSTIRLVSTHFGQDASNNRLLYRYGTFYARVPKSSTISTFDDAVNFMANTDVEYCGILATPIETPMTDEEIAMYDALHTNMSTTIITNDAGAFMAVRYVADTKTHIAQNYVPVSKYTALEDRVSALERLHV